MENTEEIYTDFARVYDELMDNTPYEMWCERLDRLIAAYGVSKPERDVEGILDSERNLVVDLGCGTGLLGLLLLQRQSHFAPQNKEDLIMSNNELLEALNILEQEKNISKETLLEAIENSLITACKNHFGKADNVHVEINRETCDFLVYAEKEVVPTKDDVEDDCLQIAQEDAQEISKKAQVGDMIHVEIKSKEFGRIATQNAKNVILQKIREEERKALYND